MIDTILLDCGGVLARPVTGCWLFPRNFHALMDEYLTGVTPEDHRKARSRAAKTLNEDHHLYTEEIECEQLLEYFRNCYARDLKLPVPEETLKKLAISETYDDGRFAFYDDVMPMLAKWQGEFRLGMVSDTHPSLRRIMRNHGSLRFFEAVSLSCEIGALKPDARMYRFALDALNVNPETAVFVDDIDANLRGAEALGIRTVKMRRPIYTDDPIRPDDGWQGPVITSLTELDGVVRAL